MTDYDLMFDKEDVWNNWWPIKTTLQIFVSEVSLWAIYNLQWRFNKWMFLTWTDKAELGKSKNILNG